MKKCHVLILLAFVASAMICPALADEGPILFGVKFTPFRFYGWQTDQPLLLGSGSLDNYLGIRVWKGMYVLTGIDFARVSVTQKTRFFEQYTKSESVTSLFIPHVGVKYRMGEPKESEVLPYVYGNVFKSISSILENGTSQAFKNDLASPWGLTMAFGAECYLKERFALGGEIGVRYVLGKAKQAELNTGKEQTFSWGFLYTALTLQFSIF
jgi:hypothetical protein